MEKKFDDMLCAKHLAGMVKFPTVSNAKSALMDFEPFYGLHDYLEKTYPLVHKHLKREVIGKAALLYTWKGTGKSKNLPVMFTAHQDVVPVGELSGWKYPPYEGVMDEGRLWGRGTGDCKSNIMAHLEAVEALLAEGFTPDFDVYLGYGWNEEVMGGDDNSAAALCRTLKDRGVTLGLLIDEGRGPGPDPMSGITEPVEGISTCEKGYADVKIYIKDKGGHSMAPTDKCIIADLGEIARDLVNNQYPYRIVETVAQEYKMKGRLMGEKGAVLANMENDFDAVLPLIAENPFLAAMFHTTTAVTMSSGSAQANILPTEASITVNFRLLPGDTVESLLVHVKDIVKDRAEVELLKGVDPSPQSRTDSAGYLCVKELYEEMVPGVLVYPSMVPGGTDAKNYHPVCDTVLRCGGFSMGEDGGAHNYNEHVVIEGLGKGPEFFYLLMKKYGDYTV